MKLVKLYKPVIHVYAKNEELQYSYFGAFEGQLYIDVKCHTENWCNKMNTEEGYKKYTCEIVSLYGEATKW